MLSNNDIKCKIKLLSAFVQLADYQLKLAREYNRNVKPREFVARDLVLRKVVGNMKY